MSDTKDVHEAGSPEAIDFDKAWELAQKQREEQERGEAAPAASERKPQREERGGKRKAVVWNTEETLVDEETQLALVVNSCEGPQGRPRYSFMVGRMIDKDAKNGPIARHLPCYTVGKGKIGLQFSWVSAIARLTAKAEDLVLQRSQEWEDARIEEMQRRETRKFGTIEPQKRRA